eukprot:gene22496-biopygen21862
MTDEVKKGTVELRNLSRDTATLFDPAQKGLDAITASGRDFGDAMKMMPAVLKTAQASGAGVDDIANSSTALIDHMKISIEGLAEAQDTLAMGGKLGRPEFDLRRVTMIVAAAIDPDIDWKFGRIVLGRREQVEGQPVLARLRLERRIGIELIAPECAGRVEHHVLQRRIAPAIGLFDEIR